MWRFYEDFTRIRETFSERGRCFAASDRVVPGRNGTEAAWPRLQSALSAAAGAAQSHRSPRRREPVTRQPRSSAVITSPLSHHHHHHHHRSPARFTSDVLRNIQGGQCNIISSNFLILSVIAKVVYWFTYLPIYLYDVTITTISGRRLWKFTTAEQLKLAIIEEWRNLGQRFIDRSINVWRQRLQKVVEKQGEHIEHVFWLA